MSFLRVRFAVDVGARDFVVSASPGIAADHGPSQAPFPAYPHTPVCLVGWPAGRAAVVDVGNADLVVSESPHRRGRGIKGLSRFRARNEGAVDFAVWQHGTAADHGLTRRSSRPTPAVLRLRQSPSVDRGRGNRGLCRFCESGSPWTWERWTLTFSRTQPGAVAAVPRSRQRPGPSRCESALPVVRRGRGSGGLCRFLCPAGDCRGRGRSGLCRFRAENGLSRFPVGYARGRGNRLHAPVTRGAGKMLSVREADKSSSRKA